MIDKTKYTHLIALEPLDYFFFGGENTFGNGQNQNYYAKSNMFPQQTSVLGLLRYLGYQNKLPIGGESFDAEKSEAQDFGYIRNLSPLFLQHRNETQSSYYLPSPLGEGNFRSYQAKEVSGEVHYWNEGWKSPYVAPTYDAKDDWSQMLLSIPPNKPIGFEEIFKGLPKIGITKGRSGENRKDSFYKQEVYKLEKGWRFAVLANLDLEEDSIQQHIAPFGAEKALFSIQITPGNWVFDDLFPKEIWKDNKQSDLPCAILVSDAFVSPSIYSLCEFAVTHIRDFRNIRTPKAVYNSRRFGPLQSVKAGSPPVSLYKSGKYNLLARGSVLWSSNESGLMTALAKPPFTQIGYNRFIIIN